MILLTGKNKEEFSMRVYFHEASPFKKGQLYDCSFDVSEMYEAVEKFCTASGTKLYNMIQTDKNTFRAVFKNEFVYDIVIR